MYVIASRTAGGKHGKPHIVYDSEKIFRVGKLTELENVDEVFMDALYPSIYVEVLELMKKGVKVYVLKNRKILEEYKRRMEDEDLH